MVILPLSLKPWVILRIIPLGVCRKPVGITADLKCVRFCVDDHQGSQPLVLLLGSSQSCCSCGVNIWTLLCILLSYWFVSPLTAISSVIHKWNSERCISEEIELRCVDIVSVCDSVSSALSPPEVRNAAESQCSLMKLTPKKGETEDIIVYQLILTSPDFKRGTILIFIVDAGWGIWCARQTLVYLLSCFHPQRTKAGSGNTPRTGTNPVLVLWFSPETTG